MNKIFEEISQKRSNYCHCVEVSSVYELENIAETIFEEFSEKYGKKEVIDFLNSLTVYYLENEDNENNENDNENEVYDFSFSKFINENLI